MSAKNPGLNNIEVVSQVIWSDSKTKQPLLSNAAVIDLPNASVSQPRTLLYTSVSSRTRGSLSASRSYQPVVRYRQ